MARVTKMSKKQTFESVGEVDEKYLEKYRKIIREGNAPKYQNSNADTKEFQQWCIDNAKLCRAEVAKYIQDKFGVDLATEYGIKDNFTLDSITQNNTSSRSDSQKYPMIFDERVVENFLRCKKTKLTKTQHKLLAKHDVLETNKKYEEAKYACFTSWYIGRVYDRPVLFKEIISYPQMGRLFSSTRSKTDFPNAGASYELKVMVAGNNDLMYDLIRLDYNPVAPHNNNIDHKRKCVLDEPEALYGTHCHYPDALYSVVYPNGHAHPEALVVDSKNMSFATTLMAVKEASNTMYIEKPVMDGVGANSSVVAKTRGIECGEDLVGTFQDRLWRNMEKYRGFGSELSKVGADVVSLGTDMKRVYERLDRVNEA